MPLRIFKARGLAATSVVRGFLITGMYSTFFIGVLYLEHVRGYSTLTTGLSFLPQTLMIAALSTGITARLVGRYGPRAPLIAGLITAGTGLAIMSQAGAHSSYVSTLLPAYLLTGIGAGLAMMPLLTIAMEDVPVADAGLASGIVNLSLQLSAAMGIALLGTIATNHTRALTTAGRPHLDALLGGYHLAFVVGAASVAVAVVVALTTLKRAERRGAALERDGLQAAVEAV
jgi:MFS family permease